MTHGDYTDEDVRIALGCETISRTRRQMLTDLLAYRARDLDERPLREGDEYIAPDWPGVLTVRFNIGPQFEPTHRIVRIPIPSAAAPEAEVKDGEFVFASEAERQAHLGEVQAAQAFMEKHGGLDETMRGLPAPPQQPENDDQDVAQLRRIAALGAGSDLTVRALSAYMGPHTSSPGRRMAVEIARRRLAEMDAAKQPQQPEKARAFAVGDRVRVIAPGRSRDEGRIESTTETGMHGNILVRCNYGAALWANADELEPLPAEPAEAETMDHRRDALAYAMLRNATRYTRRLVQPSDDYRAALRSIVESSCEVDTVRRAALALLGEKP